MRVACGYFQSIPSSPSKSSKAKANGKSVSALVNDGGACVERKKIE